jgi:fatty-acyl-CoA synthase
MALPERMHHLHVSRILSLRADEDPDRVFLHHEGATWSYEQVAEEATALAAALANLGIEEGDRVALVLPPCPEFVVSFFAVARLGAVLVPLDPRQTESELRYKLRHSEAVCAITIETLDDLDYLQLFEGILAGLPALQYVVTVGEEDLWYDDRIFQFEDLVSAGQGRPLDPEPEGAEDRLFAIVYTSGTTGKPKGVELSSASLAHVAAATVQGLGIERDDRIIGITALYHAFGLGPGILGTMLAGASLVLEADLSPGRVLDLIEELGVTMHYGVPGLFAGELREQEERPRQIGSLRCGLVAGAPVPGDLFDRVEAGLCPVLLTAYSLSETSSTLTLTAALDPQEKRRFTVGRPIAGTTVRVLGEDGEELPLESLGELAVRGPGVMRGYYRQPRDTAASFDREGFFRTGDLGIVDEDGYVHLVGRRKDVIIRAGSNVYPRELEDRLLSHPAILDAGVVGIPDEFLGEAIGAAVVPVEGAIVTAEELRDWCRQTMADHKVPDLIRFCEELPMTGTGKIRRVDLARLLEAKSERSGP